MLQKTIILSATLQAVSNFTQQLEIWLAGLPFEARTGVVLAVQELCVNIVQHAYESAVGDIRIEIDWTPAQLRFELTDHAPNPFAMPKLIQVPDPLLLPENGLGLFLIHQVFDQVDYEALQGENHWRLVKQL